MPYTPHLPTIVDENNLEIEYEHRLLGDGNHAAIVEVWFKIEDEILTFRFATYYKKSQKFVLKKDENNEWVLYHPPLTKKTTNPKFKPANF